MRIELVPVVLLLLSMPVFAPGNTTTTSVETTTTTIEVCPTIVACLYNPDTDKYSVFRGCDYSDALETGWIETEYSLENCPPVTTTTIIDDLCADVSCPNSELECPDGYIAIHPNRCDPATGSCSYYKPDCTGHYICGNAMCEAGEDAYNCPQDCGYECPVYKEPECPGGYIIYGSPDPVTGCQRPATCCGDYICSGAEDSMNCECDCKEQGVYCGNGVCEIGEKPENCPNDCGMYCPEYQTCPDGRQVRCFMRYDTCECEPCELPSDCWSIVDDSGFTHVVCEARECPEIPAYVRDKCISNGGTPVTKKDSAGCEYIDCQFTAEIATVPVSIVEVQCPSPDEIDEIFRKCESMGMTPLIKIEGGCKYVRCVQEEEEVCPVITSEMKMQVEERCRNEGLEVIRDFDTNGCPIIRCGDFEDCRQEPPSEMYDKCNSQGGEVVVRRDSQGCIVFVRCITPGDEDDIYFENIVEVPEPSKLLSIAFKLESLNIELDRLARKTDEIADYYASTGSNEADRFRRVSDMFEAAKDKVDEIKNKLRNRLDYITTDDIMEIKNDIRYIKDVVIKDILYVMLSTSEDVKNIGSGGDCGDDGNCFDRALRVCKPVTYYPSDASIIVKVVGLEGDTCVITAELKEAAALPGGAILGIDPPYTMTCKIQKYSMGISNPETNLFPYCEGSLLELLKKFGETQPQQVGYGQPEYIEEASTEHEIIAKTCVGCLNNGICDPGECRDCPDCIGGM